MVHPEKKTAPAEEATVPAGEKKVSFKIDKTRERSGDVFVSVNERTFQIKRGVEIMLPERVVEVLKYALRAEEERIAFDEENART